MTERTERGGFLREVTDIVTAPAQAPPEPPAVIRRRRIMVAVVLVAGFVTLAFSLSRTPGDDSFYVLTLLLAAVWAVGAFLSGPLHLGRICVRGRNQRPVITGTLVGLALGGVFVLGGLVTREIPVLRDLVVRVLEFADYGPLLLVVFITVINGLAEELFFRGSLYTALAPFHPVLVSTVIYVVVTGLSTQNIMLGFAGAILGAVCALERRATGGVLAPMLTHFFWGLVMVLALPPIFGI